MGKYHKGIFCITVPRWDKVGLKLARKIFISSKFFSVNGYFFHISINFTSILVSRPRIFGEVVKRESGENPEQTRCCKLHQNFWTTLVTTVRLLPDGKDVQKRSKSEDLPKMICLLAFGK